MYKYIFGTQENKIIEQVTFIILTFLYGFLFTQDLCYVSYGFESLGYLK